MHFSTPWALALGLSSVHAFRDTSPFMFFSTSEILFDSPAITNAQTLTTSLSSSLRACPSRFYVLLNQPGVHSDDYGLDGAAPRLQQRVTGEDRQVRSSRMVAEVRHAIDRGTLESVLQKSCGTETLEITDTVMTTPIEGIDGPSPKVLKVDLPAPPVEGVERSLRLRENDLWLSGLLESLPTSKYTVIYTTTPQSKAADMRKETTSDYQMENSMSPLGHVELKRDLSAHQQAPGNITLVDGPLFERYQYFTPGLFMGLIAVFFLGSILYVAISAVASLQVSYAAFDKEMGPAQQKKQQ